MAGKTYPRRCAQALFEMALETDELDRWQTDLAAIMRVVSQPEYAALLASPKVSLDEKSRLLAETLAELNPLALNLVLWLIGGNRLSIFGDVTSEYQRLLDSHRGVEQAEVATAVPLDVEGERRLTRQLETIVGKKIVLTAKVDRALVGGFVARVGGKLLDASTRSRLDALRQELAGAAR
jgi:F-type H+-transporting ATPase subunit delta